MSTTDPVDGFCAVLGDVRGVTDARALRARLGSVERERDEAQSRVQSLQIETRTLHRGVRVLQDQLQDSIAALDDLHFQAARLRRDRDTARYVVMFGGGLDPVIGDVEVSHGCWTPGRPYLDGQHVTHPVSGECYRAHTGGVPVGRMPDNTNGWVRCQAVCPQPEPVCAGPHPVRSGFALRQHEFWWDGAGERWALADLTAEHLTAVIDWLPEHLDMLWQSEHQCSVPPVPCPYNAYESAEDWLADMPLMRALLTEAQRRERQVAGDQQKR